MARCSALIKLRELHQYRGRSRLTVSPAEETEGGKRAKKKAKFKNINRMRSV
jgi:metal-dependent amidase/aminoacylase/carboxypeptidase family protein